MIRRRILALACALALAAVSPALAQAARTPPATKAPQTVKAASPESKLPAPILTEFRQSYPNATIEGAAKETEKGKTVWEVESVDNGMSRDLIYNPDGTVVEVEEQVAIASLPPAVADAVKAQYPKATITKAEKLTIGATVQFELALHGASKRAIQLTADGKPVPVVK